MHYEGVPVSTYYVIAEFASVQIIFGATVPHYFLKHFVRNAKTEKENLYLTPKDFVF